MSIFGETFHHLETHYSLKQYNSFGFDVIADHFVEIDTVEALQKLIKDDIFINSKHLIISGGNNILFCSDRYEGLVIHINTKGIETISEDAESVIIRAQAGEDWSDFVKHIVGRNLFGIENLAHIPGKVGAAPVQNIGAYGMELKDAFVQCEAMSTLDGSIRGFSKDECKFGYRNSIFKNELKGRYIITSVDFMLHKDGDINVEYGNIRNYLEQNGITNPSLQQFHDAICTIRDAKLPDVKRIGNAGSFFKNPLITAEEFGRITAQYPDAPHYPDANGMVKVPAGWLIEKAGWKGWRDEHVGVYEKQALVLVHYGGGIGSDIVTLAQKIQDSVFEKFGISITPEVNFVEP